jgi:2-iminobutanoate/2-iminopropanoate deaminase
MPDYVTDVPGYAAAHSPYSHAVVANGFVFVSGQIAVRPDGSGPMDVVGDTIEEQTRQALENVDRVLRAAGSSLQNAVKITVLLTDPEDFKRMNAAYAEFFTDNKPARSVAQLGARIPGILVSIDAIAAIGGNAR